jgi:hypothetical protein
MPKSPVLLTTVEAIREKYAHYGDTKKLHPNTAVLHIRFLLEEIERLEEIKWMYEQLNK